jgi:hypothetical protein
VRPRRSRTGRTGGRDAASELRRARECRPRCCSAANARAAFRGRGARSGRAAGAEVGTAAPLRSQQSAAAGSRRGSLLAWTSCERPPACDRSPSCIRDNAAARHGLLVPMRGESRRSRNGTQLR